MNYLWEVLIQAKNEGVSAEHIRFMMPRIFSAYMEISNVFINQGSVGGESRIEINPYYRFYDIFKDLCQPDYEQGEELQNSLFNLIMHQLAENDVLSGMTREEYHKALLLQDILEGRNGWLAQSAISLFSIDEKQVILSGMLRQYLTGCSIDLFREMMTALIPEHIVYHNNEKTSEVLIYIGRKKTETLEKKLQFLVAAFLDLSGVVDIYYEYHFGIIGVEETMCIGELAIC